MSDQEDKPAGEEDAGGDAKVGGKKKLIFIIAAVLVTLCGAGAGAYFMGLFGKKDEAAKDAHAEAAHASGHGEEGKDGVPVAPVYYELPEFLVNLNSGGKQVSFLKMRAAIELTHMEDIPKVEADMPRISDSFNTYLRELRASDLSGSAGMQRLKEELLLRLNKSLDGVQVKNIYIKQILVQ